jgi:UDP-glucose 4-epimerase
MNVNSLAGAKVLVIGASSFIGANLVPALLNQGATVYTTSKSDPAEFGNNPTHRTLDITELPELENLIKSVRPDYIFNLSGYVQGGRILENVWPTFKVNLEGTVNLLTILHQYPCKRLILLGSLEELQSNHQSISPASPYAASKIAASTYARMFHSLFEMPLVIAQLFMVYGPNQKDHQKLVPYTIQSILKGEVPLFSSGTRKADWVYVADIVEGLIQAAIYPGIEGKSIQFGTGRLTSVEEVVTRIFDLLQVEIPPKFGAIGDRKLETIIAADVDETRQLINWKSKVSLEEGVVETVDWYKKQFGRY